MTPAVVEMQPTALAEKVELLSPQAVTSPKPKVRRKVEDTLNSTTAVQRLVEYFLVVSSEPRWESSDLSLPQKKDASKQMGQNPNSTQGQTSQHKYTSARQNSEDLYSPEPLETLEAKPTPKLSSVFRFRRRQNIQDEAPPAADTASTAQDEAESREEVASPEPRSEWRRERPGADDNIHMPSTTGLDHTFQPKITARYPLTDYADNPLNPMIAQFCFPSGDVIVPSRVYELPRVHHFVLTNDKGRKVYGTCLTFFEECKPDLPEPWKSREWVHDNEGKDDIEVTVGNCKSVFYIPRVLCVLSTWPYLTAFREYLAQLYRLASSTNVMTTPIERYVLNLCMEIPAPPPGAFEVQVSILNSTIRFWAPPAKLPIAYVALPYQTLFDCLDVDNVLLLWNVMLMEHKILLVSSQCSILTVCAEILTSLLFPMRWCHLYVPLLPRFVSPMLDAPVPYLCGVVRENWLYAQQFVSTEAIVVDLDRNTVAFGVDTPDLVPAPVKKYGKLQAALEQSVGHLFYKTRGLEDEYRKLRNGRKLNFKRSVANLQTKGSQAWKEKLHTFDHAYNLAYTPSSPNLLNDADAGSHQSHWDKVQEAFLRFFVALLKHHGKFLQKPTDDKPGRFDHGRFVASSKPENASFLTTLCTTQQFEDFVTKRLYSPGEPDIVFFDQSIDAKLNRSRLKIKKVDTPFLQSAKAHKVLKKIQAVEPNKENLPMKHDDKPYLYQVWPETFQSSLFCEPKPIPTMIAAEFDRQSILVSRLRRASYNREQDPELQMISNRELFPLDYDDSPEVAAFTVFFFAYSQLIGRDWAEFQKKKREKVFLDSQKEGQISNSVSTPRRSITLQEEKVAASPDIDCVSEITLGVCDLCPDSTPVRTSTYFVPPYAIADFVKTPLRPKRLDSVPTPGSKIASILRPKFVNRSESLIDAVVEENFSEYEEARAVACAQLDLAFETLKTLHQLRHRSPDSDSYKCLMEACGRCGDTQRALELIELMKQDGLVADGEVLSCFMSAFTNDENGESGMKKFSPANRDNVKTPLKSSDAYYRYLEKRLTKLEEDQDLKKSASCLSEMLSSDEESWSDNSHGGGSVGSNNKSAFMEWFTPVKKQKMKRKRSKRKRRRSSAAPGREVTMTLTNQLNLAECLLDFLYPSLTIDTSSDSCPHCSYPMSEDDIVQGWLPGEFEDFTTCCPTCKHRFIPRFSVSSLATDFQGSQGIGTPLYCEFFSPWVLRKELGSVVFGSGGIEGMLKPEWRSGTDINSTLWWNMVVQCKRYRLPFSFLLQGSFQNQLINATPDTL